VPPGRPRLFGIYQHCVNPPMDAERKLLYNG